MTKPLLSRVSRLFGPLAGPLVKALAAVCLSPLLVVLAFFYGLWKVVHWSGPRAVRNPGSVLISGASSGLGRSLALHYCRVYRGMHMGIFSNDPSIAEVAKECEALGATVRYAMVDVRDEEKVADFVTKYDREFPVDVLFSNAGVCLWMLKGQPHRVLDLLSINLMGSIRVVEAMVPRMKERRRGQIVIIGSVGAYVPLSGPYAASKAALLQYGRTIREVLAEHNVSVTTVLPGFMKTALTANLKGMDPVMQPLDDATVAIAAGVSRGDAVLYPQPFISALYWLCEIVQAELVHWLMDMGVRPLFFRSLETNGSTDEVVCE